jgi:hypothetical protein
MAPTQRYEVNEMQLSIGSRWTDGQGREFEIDAIVENETEIWVAYTRISDGTSYRCLAEAFEHRFRRTENDSRS